MQNVLTPVATIHRAFGTPLQNIPSVTPAGKSGLTPRFMGSCALGVGYGFWLFRLPRDVYSPYPTTGDGAVLAKLDPIAAAKNPARNPTRDRGIRYRVPRTLPLYGTR